MAQGRQEEALRHYDNALRSVLWLKMRPLAVLCHLGLHVAYVRMGGGGEAEENEAAGGALLSGLGMRVNAGIEVAAHSKTARHQVTKSTTRVGRRSGSFLGSAKHV
jgi:hypothetical protein